MITFDISQFRTLFKEYSNVTDYPDAVLQARFDIAENYINNNEYGYLGKSLAYALDLMTAHLLRISDLTMKGSSGLLETASSVGQVSVTMTPPETKSGFSYWLSTTPYGLELKALLKVSSIGGFLIGGSNERSNFRKYNGGFS